MDNGLKFGGSKFFVEVSGLLYMDGDGRPGINALLPLSTLGALLGTLKSRLPICVEGKGDLAGWG